MKKLKYNTGCFRFTAHPDQFFFNFYTWLSPDKVQYLVHGLTVLSSQFGPIKLIKTEKIGRKKADNNFWPILW